MLYIMRHGETDWNVERRLQGRTDVPLNDNGRAMAAAAREEYKDVHLDVCYCSPLRRARETADILLKDRNIPILYDDRLMEMGFGECEGEKFNFQLYSPQSPINVLFLDPENYVIPVKGGESFSALYDRTGEFLEEVIWPLMEQKKDVLIMGHGAMNSSIMCQLFQVPLRYLWSFGIESCKLKKLLD